MNNNYLDQMNTLLQFNFIPAGFEITQSVCLDSVVESVKYDALVFALNNKKIVYRKANITPDRPGSFLAIWQRPVEGKNTKPKPLSIDELDYLFVKVNDVDQTQSGLFIFPVSELIKRGIVQSDNKKGKTGFRVFAPWSADRGSIKTRVFSQSGKKTQAWQLPFFVNINNDGWIEPSIIQKLIEI
ncbi:MepB family protein [Marinicellulosiphila megalodicopiae]|uniref:MepB family protein n=1 Tax=Marinicellulosiphila megalodicopiae TaxID=2724896 RepID=UPI003BB1C35E